jgi:hypothetical protein
MFKGVILPLFRDFKKTFIILLILYFIGGIVSNLI